MASLGSVGSRIRHVDDDRDLVLEDPQRLREPGDVVARLDLLEPVWREVAQRLDPAGRLVPVADDALVDAHRLGQVAGHQVCDLARIEAARQLGAHIEQSPHLSREVLGPDEQPGGPDSRRRAVREDRQDAEVVRGEPVETELRKGDDPDRRSVVSHRDDQHRFIDILGAGDRGPARIAVGVVDEDGFAVLGDPPREALAELAREQAHVHMLVGADPALEGDRDDVAERLHDIHPGVVVVDDPGGLVDDRRADPNDRGRPAHPC